MITIYWAGDSTAACSSIAHWPRTGIAQEFNRFLRTDAVRIENHAVKGRSTLSFIDEGRLAPIYNRITKGDFLFIQFGHNDEKAEDPARYADPASVFPQNLEKFVNVARNKGAIPVIITPVARYDRHLAAPLYRHDRWAEAARQTGKRLGVAVIDLTAASERLLDAWGPDAQTALYMNLPADVYPHFPQGQRDNTHLQPDGAVVFGMLIARALHALGGDYAALLCEDFAGVLAEWERSGLLQGGEEHP